MVDLCQTEDIAYTSRSYMGDSLIIEEVVYRRPAFAEFVPV